MKPESEVIIKIVTPAHYKELSLLRHKLWPQDTAKAHEADFQKLVQEMPYCAFLAYDGQEAIGFAEASLRPYVNGCLYRPAGFLEGIWVHPNYQKQNIGLKLVTYCERWAKENGAQEMASDAYLENTASHHAHQSWGFDITEKVVYFRKKL